MNPIIRRSSPRTIQQNHNIQSNTTTTTALSTTAATTNSDINVSSTVITPRKRRQSVTATVVTPSPVSKQRKCKTEDYVNDVSHDDNITSTQIPENSYIKKSQRGQSSKKNNGQSSKKDNGSRPKSAPKTQSFSAVWSGNYNCLINNSSSSTTTTTTTTTTTIEKNNNNDDIIIEPHTLILGTHPSIISLKENKYYGHPMNAFWWIVGDCLGFRRDTGISKSSNKEYQFIKYLRYNNIIPYEQQLHTLVQSGFALWDVVGTCERIGSLDQNIRNAQPNDIYGFCKNHTSIRRIVLANGIGGSKEFCKYFNDWLSSGQLIIDNDNDDTKISASPFKSIVQKAAALSSNNDQYNNKLEWTSNNTITLVTALAVSPAAAKYTYIEKRDFWEQYVYQPGLALLKEQQQGKECVDNDDDDSMLIVESPYFNKNK